jgi:hypothetical protein
LNEPTILSTFVPKDKRVAHAMAYAPWVAEPLLLHRGGGKGSAGGQINIGVNEHEREVLNAIRFVASQKVGGGGKSDQDVIRGMLEIWFVELVDTGALDACPDLPYLKEIANSFRTKHLATMQRIAREQDQAQIETTAMEIVTSVGNRTYNRARVLVDDMLKTLGVIIERDPQVGRWAIETAHKQNGLDEAMAAMRENGHEVAIPEPPVV